MQLCRSWVLVALTGHQLALQSLWTSCFLMCVRKYLLLVLILFAFFPENLCLPYCGFIFTVPKFMILSIFFCLEMSPYFQWRNAFLCAFFFLQPLLFCCLTVPPSFWPSLQATSIGFVLSIWSPLGVSIFPMRMQYSQLLICLLFNGFLNFSLCGFHFCPLCHFTCSICNPGSFP